MPKDAARSWNGLGRVGTPFVDSTGPQCAPSRILKTTSRALGNSKAVADKHYVKPQEVSPDVRKAVNEAVSGLIN
jgi:hypothetical protein